MDKCSKVRQRLLSTARTLVAALHRHREETAQSLGSVSLKAVPVLVVLVGPGAYACCDGWKSHPIPSHLIPSSNNT